jgi:hypothetical protein
MQKSTLKESSSSYGEPRTNPKEHKEKQHKRTNPKEHKEKQHKRTSRDKENKGVLERSEKAPPQVYLSV